jgi:hypothetical protein
MPRGIAVEADLWSRAWRRAPEGGIPLACVFAAIAAGIAHTRSEILHATAALILNEVAVAVVTVVTRSGFAELGAGIITIDVARN